ncbi:MAG: hypothetical protein F6K26_27915 [Moorea sp. SIO2I5]|nr:hypothetical protein [Moorena sp. SIO2I5]
MRCKEGTGNREQVTGNSVKISEDFLVLLSIRIGFHDLLGTQDFFPTPDSRFPTPDSRLPTPDSLKSKSSKYITNQSW